MSLIELRCPTSSALVEELLDELGVNYTLTPEEGGYSLQAVLPESLWCEIQTTMSAVLIEAKIPFSVSEYEQSDWKTRWQDGLGVLLLGKQFAVRLLGNTEPFPEGRIPLELEAGMSFGVGTHPTTQLMCEMLEGYQGSFHGTGGYVLDVGCGSGILSFVASALGATRVIGIDIDPEAVAVSRRNAARIATFQGEFREEPLAELRSTFERGLLGGADLVCMNIISSIQLELASLLPIRNGAYVLTSGMLSEERENYRERVAQLGFQVMRECEKDGWLGMVLRKEGAPI